MSIFSSTEFPLFAFMGQFIRIHNAKTLIIHISISDIVNSTTRWGRVQLARERFENASGQSRSIERGTQRREAGRTGFELTDEEDLPGWGGPLFVCCCGEIATMHD